MSFLNQTLLQYQLLEPRSHVQDVKKAGLFAWGLWYDTEHDSNPELCLRPDGSGSAGCWLWQLSVP